MHITEPRPLGYAVVISSLLLYIPYPANARSQNEPPLSQLAYKTTLTQSNASGIAKYGLVRRRY